MLSSPPHPTPLTLRRPSASQCLPILREFAKDSEQVVRESCEVALDMHEVRPAGSGGRDDGRRTGPWSLLISLLVPARQCVLLQHEQSGEFQYANAIGTA